MRIAAIYDIHGNLPALEAVLAEVAHAGFDRIVCGGDVVPGPFVAECLDLLAALDVPTTLIRGNGENDVLAILRGEMPSRVPPPFQETMVWVTEQLSREHAEWIASWPEAARVPRGDGHVLFCHATPGDDNEIFTERTPDDLLAPALRRAEAGLVVCGHTHMQFDRTVDDVRVINAGSVGMPFGGPGAYWLSLSPDAELRRTEYDYAAAEERCAETAYPIQPPLALVDPPAAADMIDMFETVAMSGPR